MSNKNKNQNQEENEELNLENEEVVNININSDQKIDVLSDGTEILRGDMTDEDIEEEEKVDIPLKELRKLVEFTSSRKGKDITDEELEALKENEYELERIIKISHIKSKRLIYNPKKKFDAAYRQKRKQKNRQAKRQRIINIKNKQHGKK